MHVRCVLHNTASCWQVSEQHLSEASVPGCVLHCLELPGTRHVLVSYSRGILGLVGDQFNCICAKVWTSES